MSGFSELIKNFDKTRDYVRDFFIYGFKVRKEFSRKSARTYDNEKRRVESWLGEYLRYENTGRGKQTCISADSGRLSENPLYKAYYSKSFTDNDIRLHFLLGDILSEDGKFTVKELTERLNTDYGAFFDDQTVRNKLKEYASEGTVILSKCGKADLFSLSPDTTESFFGEYEGLEDMIKFFSEAAEFGIVGNSILKAAGLKNDIFFIKHNYIVHTLEDEILLDTVSAIENKHFIKLTNFGRDSSSRENFGVPLKIFVSCRTGRRYIMMYIPELKRFSSFRLDLTKAVKDCGLCPEYDEYADALIRNESKCFGVSFGGKRENDPQNKVRIVIRADEETEKFRIERILREKRCGTLEKAGKDLFAVTYDVFDPNELMHWLKSFIGRIVSIEGAGKEVTYRFYRDISRMYGYYSKNNREREDASV